MDPLPAATPGDIPSPLPPAVLRRTCDARTFPFATTAELDATTEPIGQERAVAALRLAVGVAQPGYNLFAFGPHGVGKRATVEALLAEDAVARPRPSDWCYVNNFADGRRPIALRLPPGTANALHKDVERWVESLKTAIPAAFESDEYRNRVESIDADYTERQTHAFEGLGEDAAKNGIALIRTPTGFSFAPLAGREVMNPEDYQKLTPDEQQAISTKIQKYQGDLERIVRDAMDWRRERTERVRALGREVTALAVEHATGDLKARHAALPEVIRFIDAARADVIEHAEEFHRSAEPQAMPIPGLAQRSEFDLRRYQVNAIVDHDDEAGAPVVIEEHPTYTNLIGRVEHLSQFGTLVTDFSLIRAGSLHRANGGYLLIDALKLLAQPYAWEGLKRALVARQLTIESLGQVVALMSTVTLEPDPIPLDVKVVLFGTPQLYHLLAAHDPDFTALFKVTAEFTDEIRRVDANHMPLARLVAGMVKEHRLRHLTAAAMACVFEHCARLADDADKLSIHRERIEDLLVEADFQAAGKASTLIDAAHVRAAIDAQRERTGLTEERLREAIERDIVMIDTSGRRVGQVNGLSVYQLARTRFAQPTRITATTRLGKGDVVDIHREIRLSGAIHSKGVLTMSAFLASRFARLKSLALSASLAFEQTYGMIDGDSATVAELCALVSSLAEVPLRQDIAITGSANQHGLVQAIGGVNEKIEGFFDLCKARGLDGRQGVIIPASNVQHLMLREDVVDAVRGGRFQVWAITHVDQALALLTGLAAGEEDTMGNYPDASVNGRVAARLAQYHALAQPRQASSGAGPRRVGRGARVKGA